ncbi:hypothetical protein ACFY05_07465 [Microtetraspora fusca]|uniref:Uncharacterized protein n=1 Tax=Microtetraspora fusca TaxID=1997 RepID=A0ABW6V263_MICFU
MEGVDRAGPAPGRHEFTGRPVADGCESELRGRGQRPLPAHADALTSAGTTTGILQYAARRPRNLGRRCPRPH